MCAKLSELCQFFEKKTFDKLKQKEITVAKQSEITNNLIDDIIKNLEYENFNSKFFGAGSSKENDEMSQNCKRMNKLKGKFMCDLPLSEELAMNYHSKIKNIIRIYKIQMKDFCIKDKVRTI